jgi:hypothetical protein
MDVSRIAMSELIGYGNRTLLNGSGEISFCQRRPNLGLESGQDLRWNAARMPVYP